MKIEAHILRGRSKAKTACATCQPPVVLKSPNLRRSYSIIRLYHHTKGKVHTISPSCSIRGGTFSKKYPPLYRRCVWKTYTDEGLICESHAKKSDPNRTNRRESFCLTTKYGIIKFLKMLSYELHYNVSKIFVLRTASKNLKVFDQF